MRTARAVNAVLVEPNRIGASATRFCGSKVIDQLVQGLRRESTALAVLLYQVSVDGYWVDQALTAFDPAKSATYPFSARSWAINSASGESLFKRTAPVDTDLKAS